MPRSDEPFPMRVPRDPFAVASAQSFFDPRLGRQVQLVAQGGVVACGDPEIVLITTLGSCVSLVLHDPDSGRTGLGHFVLPVTIGDTLTANSVGRFGDSALPALLAALGGTTHGLSVKLFGGASLRTVDEERDVGRANVAFAKGWLVSVGLRLTAEDTGGFLPRRLHVFPENGKVRVLRLTQPADRAVFSAEPHPGRDAGIPS